MVLFATLGAGDGVRRPAAAAATAESAAATTESAAAIIGGAACAPAVDAALRLIGISLFQMVLLVVDREDKLVAALRTYKRSILKDQCDLLK